MCCTMLRLVEGSTTAGIAITGGACDGDTASIHFPFDAPVKRWNGIVVGDSLPLLQAPTSWNASGCLGCSVGRTLWNGRQPMPTP